MPTPRRARHGSPPGWADGTRRGLALHRRTETAVVHHFGLWLTFRGGLTGVMSPALQAVSNGQSESRAHAASVACDAPLRGLAQVAPRTPPVRYLHHLWCPGRGAFGENGARSRRTTSTSGRFASRTAKLDTSRSGSRSTGRRLSTSTRTSCVPPEVLVVRRAPGVGWAEGQALGVLPGGRGGAPTGAGSRRREAVRGPGAGTRCGDPAWRPRNATVLSLRGRPAPWQRARAPRPTGPGRAAGPRCCGRHGRGRGTRGPR